MNYIKQTHHNLSRIPVESQLNEAEMDLLNQVNYYKSELAKMIPSAPHESDTFIIYNGTEISICIYNFKPYTEISLSWFANTTKQLVPDRDVIYSPNR